MRYSKCTYCRTLKVCSIRDSKSIGGLAVVRFVVDIELYHKTRRDGLACEARNCRVRTGLSQNGWPNCRLWREYRALPQLRGEPLRKVLPE
jgi:hypothetical protein